MAVAGILIIEMVEVQIWTDLIEHFETKIEGAKLTEIVEVTILGQEETMAVTGTLVNEILWTGIHHGLPQMVKSVGDGSVKISLVAETCTLQPKDLQLIDLG